jgi:hypothetical protein
MTAFLLENCPAKIAAKILCCCMRAKENEALLSGSGTTFAG